MLAQEGVDGHVFVLDQSSDPEHRQKLIDRCAGESRVRLVLSPINLGVTAGRNALHALGSAPYLIWLDDDARLVDSNGAARAVALAESDPRIAAIGFHFLNDDGSDTRAGLEMGERTRQGSYVAFIGAGFLLRRDAFDAAGGFDARLFFFHEEGDLCLRLINLGHRIVFAPDIRVIHPFGREQTPMRAFYDIRNTIYLAAKYNFPVNHKVNSVITTLRMRRRFPWAILRGAAAGALLLPAALAHRWTNPRVWLSEETSRFVTGRMVAEPMPPMQR
jgi:GT2 family glycosyltransferase